MLGLDAASVGAVPNPIDWVLAEQGWRALVQAYPQYAAQIPQLTEQAKEIAETGDRITAMQRALTTGDPQHGVAATLLDRYRTDVEKLTEQLGKNVRVGSPVDLFAGPDAMPATLLKTPKPLTTPSGRYNYPVTVPSSILPAPFHLASALGLASISYTLRPAWSDLQTSTRQQTGVDSQGRPTTTTTTVTTGRLHADLVVTVANAGSAAREEPAVPLANFGRQNYCLLQIPGASTCLPWDPESAVAALNPSVSASAITAGYSTARQWYLEHPSSTARVYTAVAHELGRRLADAYDRTATTMSSDALTGLVDRIRGDRAMIDGLVPFLLGPALVDDDVAVTLLNGATGLPADAPRDLNTLLTDAANAARAAGGDPTKEPGDVLVAYNAAFKEKIDLLRSQVVADAAAPTAQALPFVGDQLAGIRLYAIAASTTTTPPPRFPWWWVIAGIASVLALAGVAVWWRRSRRT